MSSLGAILYELLIIDAHADEMGEAAEANDIAYTPDGMLLVSSGDDFVVRVWDAKEGKTVRELKGHSRAVEQIAVSPDGSLLSAASSDYSLSLWRIVDGERQAVWHSPDWARFVCTAFSNDGTLVAGGTIGGQVVVADTTDHKFATYRQTDGVESIGFLDATQTLITGDRGGVVQLREHWRLPDGAVAVSRNALRQWIAHDHRVQTLCVLPGDRGLLSGSRSGAVTLWPFDRDLQRWEAASGRGVAFDGDGKLLVCDKDLRVVDIENGPTVHSQLPFSRSWERVAAAANSSRIALASTDGLVVYDRQNNTVSAEWSASGNPEAIAISRDGRWVADTRFGAETIQLFDVTHRDTRIDLPAKQCHCLAFSSDGSWLAAGDMDDAILFALDGRPTPIRRFRAHRSTLRDLAFSPEGDRLATVSHDLEQSAWHWLFAGDAAELPIDEQHDRLRLPVIGRDAENAAVLRGGRISDLAAPPSGRWIGTCHAGPCTTSARDSCR